MTRSGSWRDQILGPFTAGVSRLTLVADPDGLLLEEGILAGIRERGFELIPFDGSIEFRFAYESKYRARWDRGERTDLVVVLHAPSHDLRTLPYDLLQVGRRLSFSLGDLFPNLSCRVIDQLDGGDLDALYRAQSQQQPGTLGENATKDFVLRYVFEVAPEHVTEPTDLLRLLLRRHYRALRIPEILDERLMLALRNSSRFEEWPLEQIVPDREAFLAFLQERWPRFLDGDTRIDPERTHEMAASYVCRFPGPIWLPLDDHDVRVYIDTLFVEGHLKPVAHPQAAIWAGSWAAVGIKIDPHADRARRFQSLVEAVEVSLPSEGAHHQEWIGFARRWAELLALSHSDPTPIASNMDQRLTAIRSRMDETFTRWMLGRYGGLHNRPSMPPVMLHHIPRYLARRLSDEGVGRVALIVVDGLALDQWIAIRELLLPQLPDFDLREELVFAWVPTLTSVSRQAIFAGKLPLHLEQSLHTTEREPALWRQFWTDQGLAPNEVGYRKGLRDGPLDSVEPLVTHPRMKALGLVVDKVDRIMHGMQLGASGMHNQVRQWGREGYLVALLNLLHSHGFEVHLTSDHGNTEARGIGIPTQSVLAEFRGQRARIYPNGTLRDETRSRFPETITWPALGLPDGYCPLLASGRNAFASQADRIVGHGGIALEEVIVPLIRLERRTV